MFVFQRFEIKFSSEDDAVVCHVTAIVAPGTFTSNDHAIIEDVVEAAFTASGQLPQTLAELAKKLGESSQGCSAVRYGAHITNPY